MPPPVTDPTLLALLRAAHEHPLDALRLQLLADRLEDLGDARAAAVRAATPLRTVFRLTPTEAGQPAVADVVSPRPDRVTVGLGCRVYGFHAHAEGGPEEWAAVILRRGGEAVVKLLVSPDLYRWQPPERLDCPAGFGFESGGADASICCWIYPGPDPAREGAYVLNALLRPPGAVMGAWLAEQFPGWRPG